MNSTTNDRTAAQDDNTGTAQPRNFRPKLSFYHANGKGTGSAAKFEVVPAGGDRDGAVFLTLALQKSVASGSSDQGNRQHATFDWTNRVTVKLNCGDLCQMLLVLKGQGHNVIGTGCMPKLFARFLETPDPKALDARCLDALAPTPPFLSYSGWAP